MLCLNRQVSTPAETGEGKSDYALIKLVLKGEKDEFRHLIDRYKEGVFNLFMRQIGNRSIAEELSQETFLKAYLNLKGFRFEASFGTWIYRIALNNSHSYFASRRFRNEMRTRSIEEVTPGAEPQAHIDQSKAQIDLLRRALGTLKPIYREVVVLCALEGKSYEEVAAVLKIPIGTVRSRLNKGRLLLKKEFERSQ